MEGWEEHQAETWPNDGGRSGYAVDVLYMCQGWRLTLGVSPIFLLYLVD